MFLLSVARLLVLAAQLPADSGAALYRSRCLKCHGADGRGTPTTTARLEVPPADLADCKASTAEPDVRSLCRERGWPPGELNFPRAFLVEKAYPENELVVSERGGGQELIYERRLG